jgi:regulator of RNase E activity RraA
MCVLSELTLTQLKAVSTATLTTALFKRGFRNTFLQGPQRLSDGENMVGPAYTLRYIPSREDVDTLDVFLDPLNPQRRAVEACPEGAVFVVDSYGDPRAASLGGILASRLQVLGCAGIVSDGGYRDSPDIAALSIPSYHIRPSPPTNLTRHHAVGVNEPIACGGVGIYPGDIMVGDSEGVVCVPAGLVNRVATEAFEMTVFEDFVQELVNAGASTFGLYPPTDPTTLEKFTEWRKRNGR